MKKPRLRWVFLGMFALLSGLASAAPFEETFTFEQPDGSEIKLWGKGDEFHAVFETLDGYSVVFDQSAKAYTYAKLSPDGNDLQSTGMIVGKTNPAEPGEQLKKHLRIRPESAAKKARERFRKWDEATQNSKDWAEKKAQRRAARAAAANDEMAAPAEDTANSSNTGTGPTLAPPGSTTIGNKVGLCLLIDFSDDPATIPQASIIDFCNGDNYTGYSNNGSVKKYFQDNSNGLLTYTNVVTAYIRMAQPKTYYNDTSKDCGAQGNILIRDAIAIMKALPNYATEIAPTFASLTTDGSGNVLATNVFYAGGNGGVWSYGLWPHSWSLYNVGSQSLGSGKQVFKYQITNIGTSLSLGTFCHENGHMLCGFPDIYDYGYDSKGGAGVFCLMNSGGHGSNPVQINAYLKEAAGWATVVDLNAGSSLTASVSSSGADFNKFYRFQKPGTATEYYLVENRQKTGRDANISASGIAIWHIDEAGNKDNQSMVYNTSHANYECTLMQADGLWDFQKNVNSGDARDLYYLGNAAPAYQNFFNDSTTVSARWWDGSESRIDFSQFSASGTTMTFRVTPDIAFAMTVSPEGTVQVAGPQGGPFTPLEAQYTVTNNGSEPMQWSVTAPTGTNWLTISPTGGTLASKAATTVTVSINSNAANLAAGTYSPQLVFSNITGGTTLNRTVSLLARPMAGFAWDPIPSPRYPQSPFSVSLRAVDSTGAVITPFSGTATLAGISGVNGQTITVGSGTGGWTYPLNSVSHDARTQSIYLKTEIGAAQQFTGLALNVSGIPGQTLNNFTIRLQHTASSKYNNDPAAVWLNSSWTTVYQQNVTISQTGWIEFPFSSPFNYDGAQNLMVDISFNNSSGSSSGTIVSTVMSDNRSIVLSSNSTNGDPLTWNNRSPAGTRSTNIANVKFLAPSGVTISPTVTGNFTNGAWTGLVTVNEASPDMILRATSGSYQGDSNSFAVEAKIIPAITTWPTASQIVYGQTVGASSLTGGSASVNGSFVFTNPLVSPPAGTLNVPVTFTPTDTASYAPVEGMVPLVIAKATPTLTSWPTASGIAYGQALSSSTLSGGSGSVPGSFAFITPETTPPLGTYSAAVRFTPTDSNNYNAVIGNVPVSVSQGTPVISAWPTASGIVYGQTLAASSLSGGSASVAGSFAFTVPATKPEPGNYSAAVTFTPTDNTNYQTVSGSAQVIVAKATPLVHAWPTASAIEYGQVIADSILTGGSASVPGTFVFSEGGAGFAGSDSFTFKVNDGTVDSTPATVSINVETPGNQPGPSAARSSAPEPISTTANLITDIYVTCDNSYELSVNGTALGTGNNWQAAQRYQGIPLQVGRNVVAIKGMDAGGIAAMLSEIVLDGQRLGSGSSWKVSLTAPANWKDPAFDDSTWLAASEIGAYGISPWGTGVTGIPSGTPAKWIWSSDNDLHDTVYFRFVIDVIPPNESPVANPQSVATGRNTPTPITLTGSDPDGDPLSYSIVNPPTYGALSGTAPEVIYTPPSMLDPGIHDVTVLFIPTDTTHYQTVNGTVNLEVLQGSNVAITAWPTASGIVYGQALSASTLSGGTASVPGTFTFDSPLSVLNAGLHEVAVTFTPTDTTSYNPAHGSVSIEVARAMPVINAWPIASDINYGEYFNASTLSGGTTSTAGSFSFDDAATQFTGQDEFTFRVSDGLLVSAPATVSLTVDTPTRTPLPLPASTVETAPPVTTTRGDGYTVVTFTENGTWTVPNGVTSVEALVVGGGGGAGSQSCGAGAGGLYYTTSYPVTAGSLISVEVGAGGAAGANMNGYTYSAGGTGGRSRFGQLIAYGGVTGAGYVSAFGGDQGGHSTDGGVTVVPGFRGPRGDGGGASGKGSGAGAGAIGAGPNAGGQPGGIGVQVAITGTPTYYAGGGGAPESGGPGGLGGGGKGQRATALEMAGTNGLGGGAGGGWGDGTWKGGAPGGSGIVIIAYQVSNLPPVANAQSVVVAPGQSKAITLTGTDPENDPLTYEIVTQPTFGVLTGNAPNLTYNPPPLPEPGVYALNVVFTPADTANYLPVSGTVNVTVLGTFSPYEEWTSRFPGHDLNDPQADEDGDEINNLMEYAFGMNPTVPTTGALRHSGGVITALGTPAINGAFPFSAVFSRRKDHAAAGLGYSVQFSADLSHWVDNNTVPEVVASSDEVDAVRVPYPTSINTPNGTETPKFFRVAITMP